jgi:hypothetical protein
MLEQDLIDLFDGQAAEEPPPSHASIPAASRRGRIRLRRQRVLSVAAPVIVAAAVLAVIISGRLTSPTHPRPTQSQAPPAEQHVVPPLFFWPGWLPAGMHVQSGIVSSRRAETLYMTGELPSDVGAFDEGGCTLKPSVLVCGRAVSYPVAGRAGTINGLPAYWSRRRRLLFERAPDQWATASFATHADDLRVARQLISAVQVMRYPAQLADQWPGLNLQYAMFRYEGGQAVVNQLGYQPGLTPRGDQRDPAKNIAVISESPAGTPGSCQAHGRSPSAMVNGYRVYETRLAYSQGVCAPDIDELQVGVWVSGKRPFASATAVLAQLRFFGPDPAKWPATPFG